MPSSTILPKGNLGRSKVFSSPYEVILVLTVLGIWCWVDVWPRGNLDKASPHLHRTDFTVYTAAGEAALAGKSPYAVSNARGWSYLYLPPFALLVSPLSVLPEGFQCAIWFWISVACLYGVFREFAILDRWAFPCIRPENAGRIAAWGGLACVIGFSIATFNCLQRGQVGILQLYLTLLGGRLILVQPTRTASFLGGAVLASAVILKLSPALPTVVLLFGLLSFNLRRSGTTNSIPLARPLSMTFGLFSGFLVGIWILPAMIIGWQPNQSHLDVWRREVLSRANQLSSDPFAGDSHSIKNQSPMNGFWLLGNRVHYAFQGSPMDSPRGQFVLTSVRYVAVASTLIALLAILWKGNERQLLLAFALANTATLLVVPIARGHYFMAMWPAVVWLPRWLMELRPESKRLHFRWFTIAPSFLLILHYSLERQLAPFGLLGVGVWLWLLFLTAAILFSVCSCAQTCQLGNSA